MCRPKPCRAVAPLDLIINYLYFWCKHICPQRRVCILPGLTNVRRQASEF